MDGKTKYIFVTGGVVSSLGKGITAASIGMLLKARGLGRRPEARSVHQRRPRHDVARTSTARSTSPTTAPRPTWTSGTTSGSPTRPLDARLEPHDRQDLLVRHPQGAQGRLPRRDGPGDPARHRRDQGAHPALAQTTTSTSCITEIGGTVGDIESLPFLEAIRQLRTRASAAKTCLYIHVTLVPYHRGGRRAEDQADAALGRELRADRYPARRLDLPDRAPDVPTSCGEKIALFCNVDERAVIDEQDERHASTRCRSGCVSTGSTSRGRALAWRPTGSTSTTGADLVDRIKHPEHRGQDRARRQVRELRDAYISVYEALDHAGIATTPRRDRVGRRREPRARPEAEEPLGGVDGILVPGRLRHARRSRARSRPIRYARESRHPVPRHLPRHAVRRRRVRPQRRRARRARTRPSSTRTRRSRWSICCPTSSEIDDLGGTMRLGAQPVDLIEGTRAHAAYGETTIYERHRHRYEVNNAMRRSSSPPASRLGGVRVEEPRRGARAAGASLVRRVAVPPRVQEPSHASAAAVPRLRRGGGRAA